MKKILLFLSAAALLLAGCAKEELKPGSEGEGQAVDVALSMNIQSLPTVKGSADGDGQGANANRCILEIYYQGTLYQRMVSKVSNKTASFTPRLVTNRTYDVLFWADCATDNGDGTFTDLYYNAQDLKAVEMLSTTYGANDDKRDAFFVKDQVKVTQQGSDKNSFSLKRPFAQLNVVTTDIASIDREALYPATVNMKYTAPTTFNCMTGEVSGDQPITVSGGTYATFDKTKSELTLEMDYLFAAGERSVVDIAFEAERTGETTVSHNFNNIPVQRNYRTNIKGALLTTTSNWVATIKPEWDGEIDSKVVEAGSVEAANKALQEGKTAIVITNPGDAGSPIVFPKSSEAGPGVDGLTVSIKATGLPEDATLTFNNEEGAQGPASLLIDSDAKNLVVNTPNTHVNIVGGSYDSVEATTSATTLVVEKGVMIASLDIKQGNVRIYGKVAALTRVNGVKAEMYACDAVTLANYIGWGKAGDLVVLANDIDLSNAEWTPYELIMDFDGKDHVISNMKITQNDGLSYKAMFKSMKNNASIKNLTLKNVDVEYAESAGEEARAAAFIGALYSGTIENCHVDGAAFKACQKIGSIVGLLAAECSTPVSIKNCSAKNISISRSLTSKPLQHGVGGLIGHISSKLCPSVTVEACSVENITVEGYATEYSMQMIPHAFIGNACNSSEASDHKIVLNNNRILGTNTVLPTCIYSSKYFGWGGNEEEKPDWKGKILIDGKEWAPDYPVRIVGGKGYATLDAALAAATAGQTVQILKAGNYTVQNLTTSASVVEATVEGVVFNRTSGEWVANCENTTVKNVTWNVGNGNYHYFKGVHAKNCIFDGMISTHTVGSFEDCIFVNSAGYAYCAQGYTGDFTWTKCTFKCSGKAFYAYNEGSEMCHFTFNDCTFNATGITEKCKAAIFVKHNVSSDNQKYTVNINNCTANYNDYLPDDPDLTGTPLWNVEEGDKTGADVKVYVDNVLKYDNGFLAIANAAALKNFADAVNAGKTYSGQTVILGADIDMTGIDWVPVGQTGSGQFGGTFDGQDHTISNLKINNGDESGYCSTGLFGWLAGATIRNVKVNTATVSGHHYVGVIAGYLENSTIVNCHVTGAAVSCTGVNADADGDKCGGIVGFAGNPGTPVKDCTVSNTEIDAGRDAGQVAGAAKEANVIGCSANGVTVEWNNTDQEHKGSNIRNEIIGRIIPE